MTGGVAPPVRIVTVDGPSASGKTTLGRRLAGDLDLPFVDTGLLYRGVAVAAVRADLDAEDEEAMAALARATRIEINTDPRTTDSDWVLRVDGRDPGEAARDPRRALLLARLSANPGVRAALLDEQRRLGAAGAVAVGRDCGTVVFPQATLKLWLRAGPATRAHRRAGQLRAQGIEVDEAALAAEIAGRDRVDESRVASPLRPAHDAHTIDTGAQDVDAMVARALELCRAAGLMGEAPVGEEM